MIKAAVCWLVAMSVAGVSSAATVLPAIDGIVRDGLYLPKDGVPDYTLDLSIVQALNTGSIPLAFEDRGILEFDASGFSPNLPAILSLTTFAALGPFPFTIDVSIYRADGLLSLSDFNQGALLTSFSFSGQSQVRVDVSAPVLATLLDSGGWIGFNFRKPDADAIDLNGPYVAFRSNEFPPAASLTQVPEPASLLLTSMVLLAGLFPSIRRLRRGCCP